MKMMSRSMTKPGTLPRGFWVIRLLFDEKILFPDQGSMLAVMQKHLGAETECPASKAPWRGSFPSLPVSMADAEEESELHRCFS